MNPAAQLAEAVLEGKRPKEFLKSLPRTKYLPVGYEISTGTMREEDIIRRAIDVLDQLEPHKAAEFRTEFEEAKAQDWDMVEVECDILSYMQQNFVPPFTYLGAHPGDGAAIGVWPYEDMHFDQAKDEGQLDIQEVNDPVEIDWNAVEAPYLLVRDKGGVDADTLKLFVTNTRQMLWEY